MKIKRKLNINKIRNRLNQQIVNEKKLMSDVYNGITLGTVVNTSDPQEMGRIQVFCPSLGDTLDTQLESLPWCMYSTPFGGNISYGTRGSESDNINGETSYGMWAIPKIGAQALVTVLDGNSDYRIWMGCIHGQFLPHTMPHGRFFDKTNDGPLSSNETKIEPTYSNLEEAFGNREIILN